MRQDEVDDSDDELIMVNRREDIPRFANEDEEREFWDTHSLGPELLSRMRQLGPAREAIRILRAEREARQAAERLKSSSGS